MTIEEKCRNLEFVISRYDSYYEAVNNKSNLYLTINTFILAGIITGYSALVPRYEFGIAVLLLLILGIVANLISFGFTLYAIKPYINKKNDSPRGSVIFFNDVADYHASQHKEMWQNINIDIWFEDLMLQVKLLSTGLKRKYSSLSIATWFIALQILTATIFGIILLNN